MTDLPPPPPENPPPPPPASPPPPPAFASEPPPGYQAYGAPRPQVEYASFGSRLGGYVIDGIIMFLFFVPALVALLAGPTEIEACSVDESGNITIGEELDNALCEGPTDGTLAFAGFLALLGLVGVFVYQAKLLGGPSGATVGMRAVGIKAVVADTGGPLGAGKAIGRFLFASIFSGFFYLGYLWMLWDRQKQTWQDKVVSSIVIRA